MIFTHVVVKHTVSRFPERLTHRNEMFQETISTVFIVRQFIGFMGRIVVITFRTAGIGIIHDVIKEQGRVICDSDFLRWHLREVIRHDVFR